MELCPPERECLAGQVDTLLQLWPEDFMLISPPVDSMASFFVKLPSLLGKLPLWDLPLLLALFLSKLPGSRGGIMPAEFLMGKGGESRLTGGMLKLLIGFSAGDHTDLLGGPGGPR